MSIYVICPSCSEENFGSALHCKKCQTSLIGVSRQEKSWPTEDMDTQQAMVEQKLSQSNSSVINGHAAMLQEIRSWGLWSLGLGALHLVTSGFLSAPWGILLIIVGLGSFYFRSASMFVVYAVTLGWAAFSNLISFEIGWVGFALYQFFLAFRVFQQYRLFRDIEGEYNAQSDQVLPNPAYRFFPWLGSLFGCSSILAFVMIVLIVLVLAIASEGQASIPDYFVFLEGLAVNFGILGASIGLASLLSKYHRKPLAIIGLISGVLTVLLEMALVYLP